MFPFVITQKNVDHKHEKINPHFQHQEEDSVNERAKVQKIFWPPIFENGNFGKTQQDGHFASYKMSIFRN